MAMLDQIITETGIGRDEWEREQSRRQILTLVEEAMQGTVRFSKDVEAALMARMADIDMLLSGQLNVIMHAPEFQKLEASWRGLHYLVAQTETSPMLKLRVLNVSKKELLKDLGGAEDFDQSVLFQRVYYEELAAFGGTPYGALIGDYEFGRNPQDIELLEKLSIVAACAHAPFLSAADPGLLGLESFRDLPNSKDLAKKFDAPNYAKWNSFRASEDSRYVALALPHVLMRLPYGPDTVPTENFMFKEDVDGTDHSKYLWGNAAYAMATRLTDSFATYGWCAAITGLQGGGRIDGLPQHTFRTDVGELAIKGPAEVCIFDGVKPELFRAGFIVVSSVQGSDALWLDAAPSCQKPKTYDTDAGNQLARLSVQLPYIFAVSRFAHYMAEMWQQRKGGNMTRSEIQAFFNKWIQGYVLPPDELFEGEASLESQAQYPLKEAYIEVRETPGKCDEWSVVTWLRPQFQLDELPLPLRVVLFLPNYGSWR